MNDTEISEILKGHLTDCCSCGYSKKGKQCYVCNECGEDVTIELLYLADILFEEAKDNN